MALAGDAQVHRPLGEAMMWSDDYVALAPEKMERLIREVAEGMLIAYIEPRRRLGTYGPEPNVTIGALYFGALRYLADQIPLRAFKRQNVRFVSEGYVAKGGVGQFDYDHVYPLATFSWFLGTEYAKPEDDRDIALAFAQASAVGCLVTKEEHHALGEFDRPFWMKPGKPTPFPDFPVHRHGHERYERAGIGLYDRALKLWVVEPRASSTKP